jgi:hypothetical protein
LLADLLFAAKGPIVIGVVFFCKKFINVQVSTLEALLETANKQNTHLHITIDGKVLKKKDSRAKGLLAQLKAHPQVTLNIFNPQQHGRKVNGKTVPAHLHSKVMVRAAERGSSVRPLYLTSTGNVGDMGREEENITVASLVSHEDAAAAIAKIKEIPGQPYSG